jgi:hypothetical protein
MDKFVYTKEWKEMTDDSAESSVGLYKDFVCDIERGQDENSFQFIVSSEKQDRFGDVIELDGWDLSNFLKNGPGPVLFAHRNRDLPVGTSPRVWVEGDTLRAQVDFVSRDIFPFAGIVRDMVEKRVLKSSSVGFAPLEWTFDEEINGVRFKKQELLELSIVPVPANSDAVLLSADGIDIESYISWFSDVARENGLFVCDESKIKSLVSALGLKQKMTIFDLGDAEIKSAVTKRVKDPTVDLDEFDSEIGALTEAVDCLFAAVEEQKALVQELRTEIDMAHTVEKLEDDDLTEDKLLLLVEDEPEVVEDDFDWEKVADIINTQLDPLKKSITKATGKVFV